MTLTRLCALALLIMLAACEREQREFRATPLPSENPQVSLSTQRVGGAPPPPAPSATGAEYEHNAYQLSQGKRLFQWFNCQGCHANGGGDSGPPLMDQLWLYGGEPQQIYASIRDGRPNGMPSFRGKIPEQQLWELTAYVRSLARNVEKPAAPSRSDDLFAHPSEQATPRAAAPRGGGTPASAQSPQ